jgi:hypothetical protein
MGVNIASPLTAFNVVDTVSTSPRGILSSQYSADVNGARVGFAKARWGGGTYPTGALATVVTGDILGRLMFRGHDGTNFLEMASIEVTAVGTIATTRVPTKMVFATATDAAPSVLTAALTIDQAQLATFAGAIQGSIFQTAANADMTLKAGGSFIFYDIDDSANRMTLDSANGNLTLYGGLNTGGASPVLRISSAGAGMLASLGVNVTTAEGVLHAAHGTAISTALFERTGLSGDSIYTSARMLATKTSNMGDGFGSAFAFNIRDDAGVINQIGACGSVRAGADNTGDFMINTYTAGVVNERFRVRSDGLVILVGGGLATGSVATPVTRIASTGAATLTDGTLSGKFATTNADQSVTAVSNTIASATSYTRATPDNDYTLTSTPSITEGTAIGQQLIVSNASASKSIVLQEEANLTGSKIQSLDGNNITIGPLVAKRFIWDGSWWVQV